MIALQSCQVTSVCHCFVVVVVVFLFKESLSQRIRRVAQGRKEEELC